MKILILSHSFFPNIGGIEECTYILANQFVKKNHQVIIVTTTASIFADEREFPFRVIRRPTIWGLLKLALWCDIYFQNNVSLRTLWPLLILRRPWIVAHHTWLPKRKEKINWNNVLKRFLLRFATCISNSHAIANHLETTSTVIHSPFRSSVFHKMSYIKRDKELIFVGRLVSDKGVDLLINALLILRKKNIMPRLSIIGSGLESTILMKLCSQNDLNSQVVFLGDKRNNELAQILNSHHIIVVPSRWNEPFGVVAIEAIACGCVVIGSEGGGLSEAIGPCGLTFPNGDIDALASILIDLLSDLAGLEKYKNGAEDHLLKFREENIAAEYLGVFEKAFSVFNRNTDYQHNAACSSEKSR